MKKPFPPEGLFIFLRKTVHISIRRPAEIITCCRPILVLFLQIGRNIHSVAALLFLSAINLYCFSCKFSRTLAAGFINVFLKAFITHIHLSESSQNLVSTGVVIFRDETLQHTNFLLHFCITRRQVTKCTYFRKQRHQLICNFAIITISFLCVLAICFGFTPFCFYFFFVLFHFIFVKNLKIHLFNSVCLNCTGKGNQFAYVFILQFQ